MEYFYPEYLTMSETTKKLKVSRQAVLGAIKSGRLKGKRVDPKTPAKVWVIDAESIGNFQVSVSHQKRGKKKPWLAYPYKL